MEQIYELTPYISNLNNPLGSCEQQKEQVAQNIISLLKDKWAQIQNIGLEIKLAQKSNVSELDLRIQQTISQIQQFRCQDTRFDFCNVANDREKNYVLYKLYLSLSAVKSMQQKPKSLIYRYLQRASIYLKSVRITTQNLKQKIYLLIQNVKLMFYQCSIASQLKKHVVAANLAQKIMESLAEIVKQQLILFDNLMQSVCSEENIQGGFIDFRMILLKEAKQKLNEFSKIYSDQYLMSDSRQQLSKIAKKTYSWKKNIQNNQKYLLQSLKIDIKRNSRNILGLTGAPSWIEQFNISDIMNLKYKNITSNPYLLNGSIQEIDPFYLFSTKAMTELCMLTSVSYFVMATETRIQSNEESKIKGNFKYFELINSKDLQFCKILHLKALKIAGRFLPSSYSYISHLITSYNKNYKGFMENITEEQSTLFAQSKIEKQLIACRERKKQKLKKKMGNRENSQKKQHRNKKVKSRSESVSSKNQILNY